MRRSKTVDRNLNTLATYKLDEIAAALPLAPAPAPAAAPAPVDDYETQLRKAINQAHSQVRYRPGRLDEETVFGGLVQAEQLQNNFYHQPDDEKQSANTSPLQRQPEEGVFVMDGFDDDSDVCDKDMRASGSHTPQFDAQASKKAAERSRLGAAVQSKSEAVDPAQDQKKRSIYAQLA